MQSTRLGVETDAATLAERLREQIQSDSRPDGSFFATEAELAEQYDVSRKVAREAVIRLKSLGLLESRQRKGLIIRRLDPARLIWQSLPSLVQNENDWKDLSCLRYIIEVGAIELAVEHATVEQIDQLDQLAHTYAQSVQEVWSDDRQDEVEFDFHGLILEMTGSTLIAELRQILAKFFHRARRERPYGTADEETVWQHHAIVAAIRDRDLDRARSMIRLHFRNLIKIPIV